MDWSKVEGLTLADVDALNALPRETQDAVEVFILQTLDRVRGECVCCNYEAARTKLMGLEMKVQKLTTMAAMHEFVDSHVIIDILK